MSTEGTSDTSTTESTSSSFWSWASDAAEKARVQANEFAEKASEFSKKAAVKAAELSAKAQAAADDLAKQSNIEANFEKYLGIPLSPASQSGNKYRSGSSSAPFVVDMSYITENIISMSLPRDEASFKKLGGNNINAVSNLLRKRHKGHFMIWNISEESYDYTLFDDQVLEYNFPGHPAPPLGLLFKICMSIESWLDADPKNVAVVHCVTGKGRTACLLSCVLTWLGEFNSPIEALQYIADRRNTVVDYLTVPTQRRYIQYFSNILDGVKPQPQRLVLRRVVMNTIPVINDAICAPNNEIVLVASADSSNTEDNNNNNNDSSSGDGSSENTENNESVPGCSPYVQIFKSGRIITTSVPEETDMTRHPIGHQTIKQTNEDKEDIGPTPVKQQCSRSDLIWIGADEGSASFEMDVSLQGDILLRCRHADPRSSSRVSIFRAGFHTGYTPTRNLRLTKAQLDSACSDPRFSEDFYIDLIFASGDFDVSNTANSDEKVKSSESDNGDEEKEVTERYEQSLHSDYRFWESVAARKAKAKKRRSRKFVSVTHESFSIGDGEVIDSNAFDTEVTFHSADQTSSSYNTDVLEQLAAEEAGLTTPGKGLEDDELNALDELEKELGLGIGSKKETEASASSTDVSDDKGVLEDIDELEAYLESLATPSKSK